MRKFICFLLSFAVILSFCFNFSFKSSAEGYEQDFFDYLIKATGDYKTEVDISSYMKKNNWNMNDLKEELKYFYLSEPSLFYVEHEVGIYYSADYSNVRLKFEYIYSEEEASKMLEEMKKAALEAVEGITDDMNSVEKALVVHDYLIMNCSYDHNEANYSAYDCLVKKSALCQGYSLAYLYIMRDILGFDCTVVFTDTQNHSWNYLKIGKSWYHIDVTSDDPTFTTFNGTKYDGNGEVLHDNFLLSDKAFYESSGLHRNWNTMGRPSADNTKYDDYFWRESSSALCKIDDLWYYSVVDKSSPGVNYKSDGESDIYTKICTYSFETKKSEVIRTVNSKWTVYRNPSTGKRVDSESWYTRSYLKLVSMNGKLYYNTTDAVYSYNPKNGKVKKIYTLDKENMQIFSIVPYGDSVIRVVYKRDLSYSNKYLKLRFS